MDALQTQLAAVTLNGHCHPKLEADPMTNHQNLDLLSLDIGDATTTTCRYGGAPGLS